MKSQNSHLNFKRLFSLMLFVLFAANTSLLANTGDAAGKARIGREESITIATRGLSKKLQTDLVLKEISVKFNKAEQYFVSNTQIGLRGEGTCRLDGEANDLPINFDVKIDVTKHAAAEVNYVFLNMEGGVDASSALTA